MNSKYQHYYAKIKDIYLELPGFSYFHSPSGRFRDNPKMVGRRRIKKKLYGLLTNSETKTGSYIITGFRGVGKTSLVNQVINQLQPRSVIFKQTAAIVFTWTILHLLFKVLDSSVIYVGLIPLFLGVLHQSNSLIYQVLIWTNLAHRSQDREKRLMSKGGYFEWKSDLQMKRIERFLGKTLARLYAFCVLDADYYKRSNTYKVVYLVSYAAIIEFLISWSANPQGLLAVIGLTITVAFLVIVFALIRLLSRTVFNTRRLGMLDHAFRFFALQLFVLLLLNLAASTQAGAHLALNIVSVLIIYAALLLFSYISKWALDHLGKHKGKSLKLESESFTNLIKQKVNHSQKIFVRLSFPQEAVTSKDILKSLVQNMYKELQQYAGFNRIVSRVVFGFLIWFMASWMYHQPLVEEGVKSVKTTTNIYQYLPSQSLMDSIQFRHMDIHDEFRKVKGEVSQSHSVSDSTQDSTLDIYLKKLNAPVTLTGIRRFTVVADYYAYWAYTYLYYAIDPLNNLPIRGYPHIIPVYPDLGYFLWLLLVFCLWKLFLMLSPAIGIVTNREIKKMLRVLNERCMAETELSKSTGMNAPIPRAGFTVSMRRSKSLRYPIATARDIENDLIRIFDALDRVPKIFAPPEFSFIFDELDKVDPLLYEDRDSAEEDAGEGTSESEKIRKKRELVSGIMANMKIFFTTAKAKFIFIAGREMYDASLADSSDRESFLGSIFHDVIYVSSLYKDPFDDHTHRIRKPVDITYLTERYVCGRLIPERANYEHNLTGYSRYLDDILDDQVPKEIKSIQRKKVLNMVSVFINYLAFRSKGSPMNLVKLFEDFAEEFPYREDDIFDDSEKFIVGRGNPKSFYLTFDFHAQYRVSLVAGIFRPFVLSTGTHLKKYSDKILVSTSYLLDHIYKFHDFGFSWRNLELLPEIIDINRAPLLRRHIENLVDFLSDSSIKRVDNGFVNFKFQRKVIEEINQLSKNSDSESAIFNFTLDESNSIKTHYRSRLKRLKREYDRSDRYSASFVNSISFVESVLGDLHFFDKEYDEALLQYADAVQGLQRPERELTLNETLVLTRTLMKEALVYERINTYEPAMSKYSELVEIVRKNGRRLMEIGEQDSRERRYGKRIKSKTPDKKHESRDDFHFAKSMYENFPIMLLPVLAKLVAIEKLSKQGITLKDSLRSDRDFHMVFNYLKKDEKYLLKVEYHLLKGDILYYKNGVVYGDYEDAQSMASKYAGPENPHRDFNAPYSAYKEYVTGLSLLLGKWNDAFQSVVPIDDASLDNPPVGRNQGKVDEIGYYRYFTESLEDHMASAESVINLEKSLILRALDFLRFAQGHVAQLNITHNAWNLAARLFSALGDSLLIICGTPSMTYFDNCLPHIFNPLSDQVAACINKKRLEGISRIELALLYFGVASVCYKRAGEVRNQNFQHQKILYVLKVYPKFFEPTGVSLIAKKMLKPLGEKIIRVANENRQFIFFPEYSRSRDIGAVDNQEPNVIDQLLGYYRFSYNTSVKMSILHWYDLYITDFSDTNIAKKIKNGSEPYTREIPIDAYNTVNDYMVRMLELRFKSRLNRKILLGEESRNRDEYDKITKSMSGGELEENARFIGYIDDELLDMCFDKGVLKRKGLTSDAAEFLIIDGLFCETRVIESVNLNDTSYIRGYYYLASAYLSLAWWIEMWQAHCEKMTDEEYKIAGKKLIQHLGSHEVHFIHDPEYAYQQALKNYYKCINMHSEGSEYKAILSNMYFTEGDFNDDNQHFWAAIDRMLINNKVIRRRIKCIKDKLKKHSVFSPERDYSTEEIEF